MYLQGKSSRRSTKRSNSVSPVKIGEGAFGCVHKPALTCKDAASKKKLKLSGVDTVSKIMTEDEASDEIRDNKTIESIDPRGEFTLSGTSTVQCRPEYSLENERAMDECDNDSGYSLSSASLIVMPYAGESLAVIGKRFKKAVQELNAPQSAALSGRSQSLWSKLRSRSRSQSRSPSDSLTPLSPTEVTEKTRETIPSIDWRKFWGQCVFMFRGLQRIYESGYVHFDIKPHNMLYHLRRNRMTMIDFGLLSTRTRLLKKLRQSSSSVKFHFSHPFEYFFMTRKRFSQIVDRPNKPYYPQNSMSKDLQLRFNDALKVLLNYSDISQSHVARLERDFDMFFKKAARLKNTENEYERMLAKEVRTFDSYGLGFSLLFILVQAWPYMRHTMSQDFYRSMYDLLYNMYTPDLFDRLDINDATVEFCALLRKFNIPVPPPSRRQQLQLQRKTRLRKTKLLRKRRPTAAATRKVFIPKSAQRDEKYSLMHDVEYPIEFKQSKNT